MPQTTTQTRNSYDTVLKHLARENLLPQSYLDKIDRTLIWRWKNMSAEKFTGYELSVNAKYHYETIKEFAQDINAQRIFKAYTRVIKTFQNIAFSCVDFKRKLKENKEIIVDVIQQVIPIVIKK